MLSREGNLESNLHQGSPVFLIGRMSCLPENSQLESSIQPVFIVSVSVLRVLHTHYQASLGISFHYAWKYFLVMHWRLNIDVDCLVL